MKGIVFTEFLEHVGKKFGEDMMDRIIEDSRLQSGAAYTAVGTYDHAELITLIRNLSIATDEPQADLLTAFAQYLFTRFAVRYPQFFVGVESSFDFLDRIEAHIHVEVRKLYPDAELPRIQCTRHSPNELELVYRSSRPLAAFCEGLMRGAVAHFEEDVAVRKLEQSDDSGYARFALTKS